jgi:hypothetical protein
MKLTSTPSPATQSTSSLQNFEQPAQDQPQADSLMGKLKKKASTFPFSRKPSLLEMNLRKQASSARSSQANLLLANDPWQQRHDLANHQHLGSHLNTARSTRVKPVVATTMGQGIVGDLRHMDLYSEDFSSCSPVVLFNARTGKAGLFHFPAGMFNEPVKKSRIADVARIKASLECMFREVSPTEIAINSRNPYADSARMGYAALAEPEGWMPDAHYLKAFFRSADQCNFDGKIGEMLPPRQSFNALRVGLDHDGNKLDFSTESTSPDFSTEYDRNPEEREALYQRFARAPAVSKYGMTDDLA